MDGTLRGQLRYWYVLFLIMMGCVDNAVSDSNIVTGVRTSDNAINQRIVYTNLWLTSEQLEQDHPKTMVIETDYWQSPIIWGEITTFLLWQEHLQDYITYSNRSMTYSSGEGGAEHGLSRWYAVDIDDDTPKEAGFFGVEVTGGFKYQEDRSHWEKGWEFLDYNIVMSSVDLNKNGKTQETILPLDKVVGKMIRKKQREC